MNLYGVLHCTRAALPAMVDQSWGRIITIVSHACRTGDPKSAAYATAKAGAAGCPRSIAVEMRGYGITANNIALGTMRTPTDRTIVESAGCPRAKAMLRNYAIRRPGTTDDAAAAAVVEMQRRLTRHAWLL